ncbi:MAG TPA: M12 family metallo-peptidase [Xanthomonadaceae bacterium]
MSTRPSKTTKRPASRSRAASSRKTASVTETGGAAQGVPRVDDEVHALGTNRVCRTDARGHAMPDNVNPLQHKLHISSGFVVLWARDVLLRWRFNDASFAARFSDAEQWKRKVRDLFSQAQAAWGKSAPIGFAETDDVWDFEIVMRRNDDCDASGCVLASAFFPDGGRHALDIYPKMLDQPHKEQVDTLIHELGHIFGLRHFFADVSETSFPWSQYGSNSKFTIMNYGELSELTDADRRDLRELYLRAWSGEIQHINGTRIALVEPFHRLLRNAGNGRAIGYPATYPVSYQEIDVRLPVGGCGCRRMGG